ncbi:hypothetical protein DFQ27_003738 [Actinomortierella ambigua]|uniref:Protein kinase domain-containing protein n=1 Tax=Actinomortierella ambigua TaxID=1343610 RepID=A0A9P6Q895_9FUNG|nr:hypothetical protein DFQ27_003738 [Actinomortierella ambigua]
MNFGNTKQAVLEIGEIGEPIGAGQHGAVFQGRYNNYKVAIKKFRLHHHTTDQVETIEREIGFLKRLQHRHIIQFYGIHRQGNEISLVMDFAEGGSLKQAIEDSRVAGWHIKSRIAQEIAFGLAYIHLESIFHGNLKSDNVLLSSHMEVKLCDFGLAVIKTSSGGHSTGAMRGTARWLAPGLVLSEQPRCTRGTARWLAPELVLSERPRYSTKSDMYALGMVMWEMAAMCTLPFRTINNNVEVAQAISRGRREQLPDATPAIYQHWVDLCWKQDPSERPRARDVFIVEDTLSLHQGAITRISLLYDDDEQCVVPEVSCSVFSMPEKPDRHGSADTTSRGALQAVENDPGNKSWLRTTSQKRLAALKSSLGSVMDLLDTNQDRVRARAEIQEADRGDARAQFNVGLMYETGRGVKQSNVEAVRWYIKAASQENPDAQYNLGVMCRNGRGVEQSDVEAVKWFTKAADQGNSDALYYLGVMYENGQGVEQSDIEAAKRYIMAAHEGNPKAQFNVGCMYETGRYINQSDVEAVKWYTKAASQGSPNAQCNLGLMYETGRGVDQSDVEAVKLYTKAASQGDPSAQNNLGWMYDLGQGVEQDDILAVEWYKKSSAQGLMKKDIRLRTFMSSGSLRLIDVHHAVILMLLL